MSDIVVTVPKRLWLEWIDEGDLPGEEWTGLESFFHIGGAKPDIMRGERVYVVAFGRLRGYAPLVRVEETTTGYELVRRDRAEAVTIDEPIPGFRGWRYRWWQHEHEHYFPDWRTVGVNDTRQPMLNLEALCDN